MDFAAAKKRVRETASLTVDDDAQVGVFLNEALIDFARDAATNPQRFTFNTVNGQADYSLASAAVAPNGIIRFLHDESDTAVVHTYDFDVRGSSTLVLSPTPAGVGAVTGWVIARPTPLVADADVLPFPSEYHRAVVYRALQLACEWDRQDVGDVQMWEAKYEAEVVKARRERTRGRKSKLFKASRQMNRFGADLTWPV